jgi:hypothetical protein
MRYPLRLECLFDGHGVGPAFSSWLTSRVQWGNEYKRWAPLCIRKLKTRMQTLLTALFLNFVRDQGGATTADSATIPRDFHLGPNV